MNQKRLKAVTRRIRSGGMLKAALVVLLLAVQTFAVVHEADLAAHSGDEACEVCVSLGTLGGADVAREPTIVAAPPKNAAPEYNVAAHASRPCQHYTARAPPIAS